MSHPKADAEQRAIFREKIKKYEGENRPIAYLEVKKIRRRIRCSPCELFEKYNNKLF